MKEYIVPKVSVIIPSYNRAYIISDAIQSVLSQSFSDLEVLVIDDGSTDNTQSIVENIGDARIRYYYKSNGGVSSARNLGMAKTRGQFVAFLDSDDFWPTDYLEKMLNYFAVEPNPVLVYASTVVKNDAGQIIDEDDTTRCASGNITKGMFINSFIWPSATIVKKDDIYGMFFDETLKNAEDFDFFIRLSTKGRFVFAKNIKVVRRSSQDSLSNAQGINCAKIVVLERFYFKLGGSSLIPRTIAYKKLSRSYRRIAEKHRKNNNRKAAIFLFKKAIEYWPIDIRLYIGIFRSLLISKSCDEMPGWIMPEPLGNPPGIGKQQKK